MDSFDRWCLFCDFDIRPAPEIAPMPILDDYVDAIIALAEAGGAKRVFEHDNRITRIAHAKRTNLADGSRALAMVITLGDKRGADPAFIHYDEGQARVADKQPGEVKGFSAHCMIKLAPEAGNPGRHKMLLEEVHGIGRTPVTRLLGSVLKEIAKDRGEQFQNPKTKRMNNCRPVVEIHPLRSKEMAEALDDAALFPVELFDTRPVPHFDEHPEFQVRRHQLTIKVKPEPGRTVKQAVSDLAALANQEGYAHMRVSWRLPGDMRGGSAEMQTDLADIGTPRTHSHTKRHFGMLR